MLGEVVRRLDRMEEMLRELVSVQVYTRDQRETDRRIEATEKRIQLLERRMEDMAEEKDVQALERRVEDAAKQSGTNVRQAIFSGLIPGVLFLITILIQISQARGGN
jgi:hypothetical protein